MADPKKYLDAGGVTYLWGKIKTALDEKATTTDISDAIGTLKIGDTTYSTVKGYVDAKTSGIATSAALTDLTSRVSTAEGEIDTLQADVGTKANLTTTAKGSLVAAINEVDAAVDALGTASTKDFATSAITDNSSDGSLVSAAQVATYVADKVAGLTGAMHYRGIVDNTADVDSPASGDVVVISATPDDGFDATDEYVYNGSAWEKLGSEGVYATSSALSTLAGRVSTAEGDIDALETLVGTTAVSTQISNAITALDLANTYYSKTSGEANANAIAAIKDGTTIDSFKDVETALAGKQASGDYATKAEAQGYANAVLGSATDGSTAATVYGAKAYADSLASNYATAAQGTLASTALQSADVIGLTNGEIDTAIAAATTD